MTEGHISADDQTPAQELEQQLRETIQRYQLVFKATNEVLYELNIDTGVVVWNDGLFTQFGYDSDENSGTMEWWAQHIHSDDALRVKDEIYEWLESDRETWVSEYRFLKSDGTYVDVRDRGVVQRTRNGKPVRIIGSFLDITRQKQLDTAKDEYISLVSHQLRTPLTAIRLYSEMLANGLFGPIGEKQQEPVQHITDATIRLIDLVSNILDISKLESGHMVSDPRPVKINKFLQLCIDEVMPLASDKGVKINFIQNDAIDMVSIDSVILGQVVHNLLTNAVRYTKPDAGLVEIGFDRSDSGYLLTVKDNGIGIPQSAQSNIFKRFYRAQNATSVSDHGTGLGLYMIKLMIESAGCYVWFHSAVGKGTTFYVQLPHEGMRAG